MGLRFPLLEHHITAPKKKLTSNFSCFLEPGPGSLSFSILFSSPLPRMSGFSGGRATVGRYREREGNQYQGGYAISSSQECWAPPALTIGCLPCPLILWPWCGPGCHTLLQRKPLWCGHTSYSGFPVASQTPTLPNFTACIISLQIQYLAWRGI